MGTADRPARVRSTFALLVMLGAFACAVRRPPTSADMSGFLDDYRLLRPGGRDDVRLVYRNPAADWGRYHAVILEPVAIWRSGRQSLDPVPGDDLLRLAWDFEQAVRSRLGRSFTLVDLPGAGVMRIRLGITAARTSDTVLDVVTVPPGEESPPTGSDPLDPETRRFLSLAVVEG